MSSVGSQYCRNTRGVKQFVDRHDLLSETPPEESLSVKDPLISKEPDISKEPVMEKPTVTSERPQRRFADYDMST